MFRKIILLILLLNFSFFAFANTTTANSRDCTVLGPSDTNTFKEYCYKITDAYLELRSRYKVDKEVDSYLAKKISDYSAQGYNYLPDSLVNKNYLNHVQTYVEKAIKEPTSESVYSDLVSAIDNFLQKTIINEITGEIESYQSDTNAPVTVTFRGNVSDPTGAKLENYNYTWWISEGGKRKIIGTNKHLNYTFKEEGIYSVFLDVTSNHKNSLGNTDVLSFSKSKEIVVKEKVASMILNVNSKSLGTNDELKFTPDESIYGLLFDATSSTPTSGTKFVKTEWDFGNGIVKSYNSAPKIERVVYANEGTYNVTLKLRTNDAKTVERKFSIVIRNPIASINATSLEGYLGDKFTFSATSYVKTENLTYVWEIVDLKNDAVILKKNVSTLTYSFPQKGRYNVRLTVTAPTGEKDYDNKIIYINSRPPVAAFSYTIPNHNKPNTIFLDASSSYDLDHSDDGKLEYNWIINGNRVKLDNSNYSGSNGYFTFENIGEQSVVLEVVDPDDMMTQISKRVNVNSVLSVDFQALPKVSQVDSIVRFSAISPNARYFEWDFGDGNSVVGSKSDETITHKYKKSGTYRVTLTVRDDNENKNSLERVVFVGDAEQPFANISISKTGDDDYSYQEGICNGKGAYIVNRVDNVGLSARDSIDITGLSNGLNYSWKIGNKYYSTSDVSVRFDDIGCIPVKLTVKSQKNGRESVAETYLKVENLKPTLTGLDLQVKDISSDPVIVDVRAVGNGDRDGVIQSYLWYYYTDVSNDPQDFRATKTPSTTFVLPKITGTYYFVVVLKDNNEERFSSEELNSKYYLTLTGDNVNTPIVGISADNTSIKVGEEVVFTANVTNVLGQNLNKEVKYSWDFDGDGFYDSETENNVISHKFTKSGEFRVKVKVKNKGYSNTKTVTVNVSNVLKPDFSYISIGNSIIFFDKSSGSIDKYSWDMGDGTILDKKGSFIYNYDDGKPTHIVKLRIYDGSSYKEYSQKITRDLKAMIDSRKPLSIYSNYSIDDDKIVLNEEVSDLQIYVKSNLAGVEYYAVDFNIENDSDLNGGKDDDEDNKKYPGYTTGGPINIELNSQKTQKIRVFLKNNVGTVLESKIFTIEKKYIKEEVVISSDSIQLDGVSDNIKKIFDRLKMEVSKFDSENKQKGLTYLQKIQEEWPDKTERTKLLIEFQSFIDDIGASDDIGNLAEGLLVEGNEEEDENGMILIILKNLIPENISCSSVAEIQSEADAKSLKCHDLLTSKLDTIYGSSNLSDNRVIGKDILNVIKNVNEDSMSNEDKMTFRAFLEKLVNKGGELSEEVKKEVLEMDNSFSQAKDSSSSGINFGGIFKWIMIGLGVILLIFFVGGIIYFISYKLKGGDNESFSDYVAERTDNVEEKIDVLNDEETKFEEKNNFDPLSDMVPEVENKQDGSVPAWLKDAENNFSDSQNFEEKKIEKIEEIKEEKVEELKEEVNSDGDIPDWLKAPEEFSEVEEEVEEIKEEKVEELKEEVNSDGDIPDWLKAPEEFSEVEEEVEEIKEEKVEELKEEVNSDGDIPDWLKAPEEFSEVEEVEEKEKEEKVEELKEEVNSEGDIPDWLKTDSEPKLETKEELDEFTKISLEEDEKVVEKVDEIPDWLKSSIEEEKTEKRESDDFSGFDSLDEASQKEENLEQEEEKKQKTKKTRTSKKTTTKKSKEETPEQNNSDKNKSKDDELWDDGMKIPDWLKTDSDK